MTKNLLNPGCRARSLALVLVLGLGCAPSLLAQSLPLAGRWLLEERPDAQSPYTVLTIKDMRLSWSGPTPSSPKCVQQFVLQNETPGTVYADGHGTRFVAGVKGSIPTYLLKLGASTCGGAGEQVRIRFPLIYDTKHIEFIEYANGKPATSRRFRRKK
jgi:hypothetical protein